MTTVNFYHFLSCFCLLVPLCTQAAVLYVDLNSPGPAAPFTTWATAATKIQDAIDVAVIGDVIMVTNGVYATGGRAVYGTMTNRVAVTKPVHLLSVNGPQFTVIQGYQIPGTTNGDGAIRCVYLTDGASLSGFTLTNGATRIDSWREDGGGGVWCESTNALVSDCLIIGNSASSGGGAYSGTLRRCELRNNTASGPSYTNTGGGGAALANLDRCTIINNHARTDGGGADRANLDRCTVINNYAAMGGGIFSSTANCSLILSNSPDGSFHGVLNNCVVARNLGHGVFAGVQNNCTIVGNMGIGAIGTMDIHLGHLCRLNNCIVYDNSNGNYIQDIRWGFYGVSNTCTYPELPQEWQQWEWPGIANNITNAPGFIDLAAGDYHLQPSSPCINAGANGYVLGEFDLDGSARIVGPRVDMGAYEFPSIQPALRIVSAGTNVLLAWPLWASDFELQQTTVLPPSPTDWHSSGVSPIITNGQNEVLLPVSAAPKLFRLSKPQLP